MECDWNGFAHIFQVGEVDCKVIGNIYEDDFDKLKMLDFEDAEVLEETNGQ